MKKGNIKTIFIIVLIIINVSLVSFFISMSHSEKQIAEMASEQMESLLIENNIVLDRKIIPKGNKKISGFYIDRVTSGNTKFIESILGENYESLENGTFKTADAQLMIENESVKFVDNNPEPISSQDYEKACVKYLENIGVQTELYKYKSTNPSGNNTKLIFSANYEEYEIFDSFISIEVSKNGICGMQAKNLILASEDTEKNNKAVDINSVLVNLIKEHSEGSNKITSIVSIKLGYYIGEYTVDYGQVLSIPAWQIVTNDGQIYCYDARNGRFINE